MRIIIIFNVVTVSFAGLYGSVVFRAEHWNSGKLYSANAAYYDADDTHVTNFGPVCRGSGLETIRNCDNTNKEKQTEETCKACQVGRVICASMKFGDVKYIGNKAGYDSLKEKYYHKDFVDQPETDEEMSCTPYFQIAGLKKRIDREETICKSTNRKEKDNEDTDIKETKSKPSKQGAPRTKRKTPRKLGKTNCNGKGKCNRKSGKSKTKRPKEENIDDYKMRDLATEGGSCVQGLSDIYIYCDSPKDIEKLAQWSEWAEGDYCKNDQQYTQKTRFCQAMGTSSSKPGKRYYNVNDHCPGPWFKIVPCEKCGETFTNDDYNQDYVDYDSSYSDYRRKRDADECSDCQDHGERFNLVSEKSKLVIKDKDIKNYLEDEDYKSLVYSLNVANYTLRNKKYRTVNNKPAFWFKAIIKSEEKEPECKSKTVSNPETQSQCEQKAEKTFESDQKSESKAEPKPESESKSTNLYHADFPELAKLGKISWVFGEVKNKSNTIRKIKITHFLDSDRKNNPELKFKAVTGKRDLTFEMTSFINT